MTTLVKKKCVLYSTNRTFHGAPNHPQGALLQAAGLGAEVEMGAIWPDSAAGWFRSRGTSTAKRSPRYMLPPLVGGVGGLVCESVGTDLLSDHFETH